MRAHLRPDAILQRRDDLAARRVILGIGAEYQGQVERQPHRVALNLHVAFLHDVEQSDLNLAGQIRQLVDGENAAIGARQQPVMHGKFVAQLVPAFGRLDWIDVADQIGDGHVRSRQLLDVTLVRPEICNRSLISCLGDQLAATAAERLVGIVTDLAAGDVRQLRIEKPGQRAQDAALRLATQSQQNKIVSRQDGIDHVRRHRILVADDAGKHRPSLPQTCNQVFPQLIFHVPGANLFSQNALCRSSPKVRGRFIRSKPP